MPASPPLKIPRAHHARIAGSGTPPLLRKVSVRKRIYGLCFVGIAVVLVVTVSHLWEMHRVERKLHKAFQHTLPMVENLDQAHAQLTQQQLIIDRAVRQTGMSDARYLPQKLVQARIEFEKASKQTLNYLEAVHAISYHGDHQSLAFGDHHPPSATRDHAELIHRAQRLQLLQRRVLRLANEDLILRARRLNEALTGRQQGISDDLLALTQAGHREAAETRDSIQALLDETLYRDLMITIVVVLGTLALGFSIARSIAVPLSFVTGIAQRLSTGERRINAPVDRSPDEAGQLLRTLYQLDDAIAAAEEDMAHRTEDLELTNERLEEQTIELATKTQELETARISADAANHAKSAFLANMSHEIRTPMTAILGYAEVLRDESISEKERCDHLNTIQRNGQHLLTIINDILDVSKIEANQMTVEQIETRPLELLDQVISLLKVRAEDRGVDLQLEPAYPLPTAIQSDPVRFRQILLNLIGNAIKFSPQGRVTVRPRFEPNENRLIVQIADSGIGMSPEQVERLFQPFTQADGSTTRKFGGTGLGLTISKRLATMLGGDIEVTSTPGQGSTFTVSITTGPVDPSVIVDDDLGATRAMKHRPTLTTKSKPAAPDEPLAGRILLAEDGKDNQRLITFILKKAGFTVDLAEDGQQALDKLAEARADGQTYDVVLMDMQMPRVDGLTATRTARQSGYTGPIVALTAHAMDEHRKQAMDAGCTDFATKPIDRAALLELLEQLINPQAEGHANNRAA
ncbi:MAG: ATP-binding protein [Planctomycetota bacterium]